MLHICKIKFNATSERSTQADPEPDCCLTSFFPDQNIPSCRDVYRYVRKLLKTNCKNSLKPNRVTRLLLVRIKMLSPSHREKS